MPRTRKAGSARGKDVIGAMFGHIPGNHVGKTWENRKALAASSVHPPLVAGIYGRKNTGARSVVLAAGGFDDEDHGDHFIYIGSGGRDPGIRFGPQTCDQSFENNLNQALRMSARRKTPVRVIRGSELKSKFAPQAGFRYDGLYTVSNPRIEMGSKGLMVCKFDFKRASDQAPLPPSETHPDPQRSDIEIRRAQWLEHRANERKRRRSPSLFGSSASHSGSDGAVRDMRSTPISVSDDDEIEEAEEDQEDIFGDIDDIEAAMEPVSRYLGGLQAPQSESKYRRWCLLHVGRHVNKVLEEKALMEKDEAGRDVEWWFDALWSYVAQALPSWENKTLTAKRIEQIYKEQEDIMNKKKEKKRKESETSHQTSQ